jgi:CubicO group peptidase (beta-lactamase class C family)
MRRRLTAFALAACVTAASAGTPAMSGAASLATSATPAAPVASASPAPSCADAEAIASAGFDAARLCQVLQEFRSGGTNFHGLVIARHGTIVAQAYRSGRDKSVYSLFARTTEFDAQQRHDLRSISKSITSLLWGIAQGQGKTPPLDTPVLDLLPELQGLKTGGRQAITLRHLLSMSSGLEWNEPNIYNSVNDEFGLYWRGSQPRYVFDRAVATTPGARFNYNGGGTAVLAQILSERVGMPLPDYARRYLFDPLGITDWEWLNDFRGRPLAFAGVRLRPVDLARIGQLVLQHGQWNGKQVVPADWIAESTRPQVEIGDGMQYGYQWWLGKADALGHQVEWSAGIGNGGQRLFVLPALDMVVVMTAGDYNQAAIIHQTGRLLDCIVATVRE